jgi:Arc/MetJ family transcription regulator
MGRTKMNIDDEACRAVMERYGLATKSDAVNLALRTMAEAAFSLEEALAMRGSGWEGDLDELRESRLP